MANKDFLSQFSGENNKPDSFKQEERIKVEKEKKPVNVKLLVIVLTGILLVAAVVLFFILRPTIEVKDFVGTNVSEVKAWIKQNEISSQGIIFREEYNFDYDEGYVIYQSIDVGKKVRKDVKMDFTISLGADPDEIIKVPDLENMLKEELQQWSKENKLTKTKIMTAFSEDIPEGEVINVDFKNSDRDNFTRSSSLTITVSKGPQPAGVITVPDFKNKLYSEAEEWANTNKITLKQVKNYSDDVAKGYIISQSVDPKKEIKEDETLTVYVSLGKAVYAEHLVGMEENEANKWASKNDVYLNTKYQYSNISANKVISQSISEGNIIDDEITIVVSLGKPDLSSATTYDDLKSLINEYNEKGAKLKLDTEVEENSDSVPVGELIEKFGEVAIGTTIKPKISKGRNIWVKVEYDGYIWSEVKNKDEDYARKLCELAGVSYVVKYEESSEKEAHMVISVKDSDGNDLDIGSGKYISESEVIVVTICSKKIESE